VLCCAKSASKLICARGLMGDEIVHLTSDFEFTGVQVGGSTGSGIREVTGGNLQKNCRFPVLKYPHRCRCSF